MIRSKKVLVFLSAVVFCLSLSIVGLVAETKADACYALLHTWDCSSPVSDWLFTNLLLENNGTFLDLEGGGGYWGTFGASLFLQYEDGCLAFYGGTKKQGTKQCTDGNFPGDIYDPGCWLIKKTNFANCLFLDKGADSSKQGPGVSGSSAPPRK